MFNHNYNTENNDKDKSDECCATPHVISNGDGLNVCTNCGMVHGQSFIGAEKRAYSAEEVSNRRRTEPRWRNYGPRTIINKNGADSKGRKLVGKTKSYFNRLSKIQGSLVNSLERNFWEARPKMNQLARKINIPDHILETSWAIYSEVAKQKLTMGRSIDTFVTASLYAAIRIHDFPRLLEEVADLSLIPLRSVHRSLGLVVRKVLPALGLKYTPISAHPLVFRFGNDLNLSVGVQKVAADMLKKSTKRGLASMGKDPKGIAAAVLYMASKPTPERLTQADIATITRVTEVTLRTRAKQIKQYL